MQTTKAIATMEQQKNAFLEEWVDYGEVTEAYDMAILALKRETPIEIHEDRMGDAICPTCNAIISHVVYDGKDVAFCRMCGQAIKWGDAEE